jgi:pSer/pThr/pTyr-binding forkhead associated (FHA) protein
VALPADTFVSQVHARVFRQGDGYWVEDLGSTNGTLVNGRRVVGAVPVRRGDRVQVGRSVLELQK